MIVIPIRGVERGKIVPSIRRLKKIIRKEERLSFQKPKIKEKREEDAP